MEVYSWENHLFLWAMASMAMLVITRGYNLCVLHQLKVHKVVTVTGSGIHLRMNSMWFSYGVHKVAATYQHVSPLEVVAQVRLVVERKTMRIRMNVS